MGFAISDLRLPILDSQSQISNRESRIGSGWVLQRARLGHLDPYVQDGDCLVHAGRLATQDLSCSPPHRDQLDRPSVVGHDGDVVVAGEGHGPDQADRLSRAGSQSRRDDRGAQALFADVEAHRQAGGDLRTAVVTDQRGDDGRGGQAGSGLHADGNYDQARVCADNVHRKGPDGAAVPGLVLSHDPQGVPSNSLTV